MTTDTMPPLLPCPCCKSPCHIGVGRDIDDDWFIECCECHLTMHGDSEDEVRQKWNRRADLRASLLTSRLEAPKDYDGAVAVLAQFLPDGWVIRSCYRLLVLDILPTWVDNPEKGERAKGWYEWKFDDHIRVEIKGNQIPECPDGEKASIRRTQSGKVVPQ